MFSFADGDIENIAGELANAFNLKRKELAPTPHLVDELSTCGFAATDYQEQIILESSIEF